MSTSNDSTPPFGEQGPSVSEGSAKSWGPNSNDQKELKRLGISPNVKDQLSHQEGVYCMACCLVR